MQAGIAGCTGERLNLKRGPHMTDIGTPERSLIEGRPALIAIDIQQSAFVDGHRGDYFCRAIEDCVAGSGQEAHEGALRAMEYLQTGARRSLDEVLAAMDSYGRGKAAAAI